jgi:selenocysteine lyase/cysteine desulfurase
MTVMENPFFASEEERQRCHPIVAEQLFWNHAAVTPLPECAVSAIARYARQCATRQQEFGEVEREIHDTRTVCAEIIGATAEEVALLGPTSLGISLIANGIPWAPGDEVLCYQGDYPANVYPWLSLRRRGVNIRYLKPKAPGAITPELVAEALRPETRLVALASAHFLTGYRIDVDAIGRLLRERDILFSVDAIQTLGAFPFSCEYVDFLSADAHKWLLGPLAIGMVFVARRHFERVRPTLLGAWNVRSPRFAAQETIEFPDHARRYEPGVLNFLGMHGMRAAIRDLQQRGIDAIARYLINLKAYVVAAFEAEGFILHGERPDSPAAHSTSTFRHPTANLKHLVASLEQREMIVSLRHDREGNEYIRLSPHFYNTPEELDRLIVTIRELLPSGSSRGCRTQ